MKVTQLCLTLCDPVDYNSSRNSWGQNTGMGNISFLQAIFPTQGSNQGLLYCRRLLYQLSHRGRLRILGWVAYTFSSGSSQPRNWTRVYCIAGGFFTNWAIREAPVKLQDLSKEWGKSGRKYWCLLLHLLLKAVSILAKCMMSIRYKRLAKMLQLQFINSIKKTNPDFFLFRSKIKQCWI